MTKRRNKDNDVKQAPAGAKRVKRKGVPRAASSYRAARRNILRAAGGLSAPARGYTAFPYTPRRLYPNAVEPGSVRRAKARAAAGAA